MNEIDGRKMNCSWTRKWKAFNSFDVECLAAAKMYVGEHTVAVPPDGARFCCWCGREIAFKEVGAAS